MAEDTQKKPVGLELAYYVIGAVKPLDEPNGRIYARGAVRSNVNIPLTGLVVVTATRGDQVVSGQQRVMTGGLIRSIFNPQSKVAEFNFEIPVADIGPVGTTWKVKIQTGNLLGRMNVADEKFAEIQVMSFVFDPKPLQVAVIPSGVIAHGVPTV